MFRPLFLADWVFFFVTVGIHAYFCINWTNNYRQRHVWLHCYLENKIALMILEIQCVNSR